MNVNRNRIATRTQEKTTPEYVQYTKLSGLKFPIRAPTAEGIRISPKVPPTITKQLFLLAIVCYICHLKTILFNYVVPN